MLRRVAIAALAPVALLIAAHATSADQSGVDKGLTQELVRLEQQRLQAYVTANRAVIAAALAPEYVHTNLLGQRTTKQQELDEFYASGRFKLAGGEIKNAAARRYGPVAVLLADVSWSGATYALPNGGSVDLSGTYSVTRVYVLRDHRWLVASSHASRQTAAPARTETR